MPPSLDVPAGGTAEAHLRLTAPVPEPGQEETRQVGVTATSDDGTLDASLTLTRRAPAAPVRRPVVVRLEPSHLRTTGGEPVAFDVLLDDRAGEVGAAVELTGRDPQRLVAFSFGEDRLVVPPHHVATVHALARTAAPAPGTTQQRPFTVVADDGTSPVEASGVLETTSVATAISTARLLVDSPLPDAGATVSRRLLVTATDATAPGVTASVDAEAVLTQTGADHRPAAERWLVVLGALLAIAGALLPWLGTMVDPDSVVAVATDAVEGDDSAIAPTATAVSTVLVVLLALLMLLGLNGAKGRGIRFAALLIALVAVAAAVGGAPATGLALVGVGALLGFVGGVLARPRLG